MPLTLLPYPKIPTARADAATQDDWVASEKVHGAQLVIGADEGEVRIGKRKAWLNPAESFFCWQMQRAQLMQAGRAIHRALGSNGAVWIYGELFGGGYPHPLVPAIPSLTPVQTGIWYAPDLHYAVFDIVHAPEAEAPRFLGHEQVLQLATDAGLEVPPLLGRGKFSELDRLPARFPSRVSERLGLPALTANSAEGYVLKPARSALVSQRPSVKRKIAEFDEQRFDESEPFDENAHLSLEALLVLGARFVNSARLASARSKVGADESNVVAEVVLDVFVDLKDALPRRIAALSSDEESALLSELEAQALALFRKPKA